MSAHLNGSTKVSLDLLAKSLSETALLDLLVENLDDYFVLLILKYEAQVQDDAKRMGLSYDDVQEIKQITFSNAYFALKHYSEETIHPIRSSLQALLREITKNAALNLLNQKKRNVSLEQASEVYSQDDDMLDGAVSAEYFGYIDLLPEKYRVLLKVLVVYDVSYAELAQISGLKVSVVKARISQARKLLRQIMREKQIKQEGE